MNYRVVADRGSGGNRVGGRPRRCGLGAGGIELAESRAARLKIVRVERERRDALLALVGVQIRRRRHVEEDGQAPIRVELIDASVLIGARFLPGMRLPTYIASGFLKVSFFRFSLTCFSKLFCL